MIVKKCPTCKTQNLPDKTSCRKCGASLEDVKAAASGAPWQVYLLILIFFSLAMGALYLGKITINWITAGIAAGVSAILAQVIYWPAGTYSRKKKPK